MGARAGALGLRNFGQALAKLRKLPGMVKSWQGMSDFGELREIEADFQRQFPTADKLRHSIAHPEFYADPAKLMSAAAPIEQYGVHLGPGSIIQGSIFNNTFIATFEGETLQYSLSADTSLAMRRYTDRIYDVFGPLDWSWSVRNGS